MLKKPWNVKVDSSSEPEISISYPKEKIETIFADDGSNDGTVRKVQSFIQRHPDHQATYKVVKNSITKLGLQIRCYQYGVMHKWTRFDPIIDYKRGQSRYFVFSYGESDCC